MVQGNDAPPAQGSVEGDSFAQAWQDLRDDESIQFSEVQLPERDPPPDWFLEFMQWLSELFAPVGRALVHAWPVLKWVLLAILVLLVAYALVRLVAPDLLARRKRKAETEDWVPAEAEALALLEEADRLAEEGRYDEATHLLLKRSVGQIAAARPEIVEPSSTARELSDEPRIPERARTAFAVIAGRVERSLFALTALNRDDWQAARDAYADFALQQKALAA